MFYRTLGLDKSPQLYLLQALSPIMKPRMSLSSSPSPRLSPYLTKMVIQFMATSDLYQEPFPIPWDATIFGVDNGNIPLYVNMSDLWEIIQGNQMLNIAVIQLWII